MKLFKILANLKPVGILRLLQGNFKLISTPLGIIRVKYKFLRKKNYVMFTPTLLRNNGCVKKCNTNFTKITIIMSFIM